MLRKLDAILEQWLRGIRFRNGMREIRYRDNIDQIVWRLSLCGPSLPVDAKCALTVAKKLKEAMEARNA